MSTQPRPDPPFTKLELEADSLLSSKAVVNQLASSPIGTFKSSTTLLVVEEATNTSVHGIFNFLPPLEVSIATASHGQAEPPVESSTSQLPTVSAHGNALSCKENRHNSPTSIEATELPGSNGSLRVFPPLNIAAAIPKATSARPRNGSTTSKVKTRPDSAVGHRGYGSNTSKQTIARKVSKST